MLVGWTRLSDMGNDRSVELGTVVEPIRDRRRALEGWVSVDTLPVATVTAATARRGSANITAGVRGMLWRALQETSP